jgi:thiol:disulfide interchange protein DsbC
VYKSIGLALIWMFIICTTAYAKQQNSCGNNCVECHSLSPAEAKTILKGLGEVKDVRMSPIKGLWELTLERDGRQAVAYMDFAKKYLLPGPVFEIATVKQLTTSPVQKKETKKIDVSSIPLADSIIMGNPMGRNRIFVFTDPDCPFCARQHTELRRLTSMDKSVAVYVKMFPLKMHPKAYDKARVILGSGSPDLLDKAFSGEKLPQPGEKDAKEPVDATIRLGESLGIKGTPALIFPDGRIVAGFRDKVAIQKILREIENQANRTM